MARESPSRRTFLRLASAGMVSVGLAGCTGNGGDGGGGTDTGTGGSTKTPLKIGGIYAITGPYSQLGSAQRDATKLAIQQMKQDPDFDREINHIIRDSELSVEKAAQHAKELIGELDVDILIGATTSSSIMAVTEFAKQTNALHFHAAGTDQMHNKKCHKTQFQMAGTSMMDGVGTGQGVLANNLGKRWYTLTIDYSYGYDVRAGLQQVAKANDDVELVGNSFSPIGQTNYSSIISKIKDANPDVVFGIQVGSGSVAFMKQAVNSGLTEEVNVTIPRLYINDALAAGPEITQHVFSGIYWTPNKGESGEMAWKNLVKPYREKYNKVCTQPARDIYMGLRPALDILKEMDTTDVPTVEIAKQMEGMKIDGWEKEDVTDTIRAEDHLLEQPYYVQKGKSPDQMSSQYDLLEVVQTISTEDVVPDVSGKCEM